jgi:phospholipase C
MGGPGRATQVGATGHLAVDGAATGPLTMGYYTGKDLSFYYAPADAFTICDHYHRSVIGPTDPNRLYTMSAWLLPAGTQGGPILSTSTTRVERVGTLSWTTMPEQLQASGVSWKVYGDADGNFGDNVLPYFKQYQTKPAWPPTRSRPPTRERSRPTWPRARCRRSPGYWRRSCPQSTRRCRPNMARRWRPSC